MYYKDIETSKDEKRSYNERMAANARERLAKNAANKSKKQPSWKKDGIYREANRALVKNG